MSTSPQLAVQKRMVKNWERFINSGTLDLCDVRSTVATSWQRCKIAGVNPVGGICKRILSDNRIEQLEEENKMLLDVARPIIKSVYNIVQGSGFMVVLTNSEGIILETMGDGKTLAMADRLNFFRGADWTEESVGTNAIGTCLVTGVPIQITGAEHFCTNHHLWTCSAAPIRNPGGLILGCLDMSGPYDKMHPHTLGLIVAAAQAIEKELCREMLKREWNSFKGVQVDGVPAFPHGQPAAGNAGAYRARFTFDDIIGTSRQIRAAVNLARRAAACSSTVLLLGESGSGKEIFAQAIHNGGDRRNGPFIPVNCASLPAGLIQSELFGYSDGAFTGARRGGQPGKFEMAHGGTLFLDEIGDMPLEMQANLLRVLQERNVTRVGGKKAIPVDVRIIAATNKDLFREVQKGNFREDLFYRINVLTIEIPPLRERAEDLSLLIRHFLAGISARVGKNLAGIDPAAMEILLSHRWPGNVRELANVLEQAIIFADGPVIQPGHLPRYLTGGSRRPVVGLGQVVTLEQMEINAIKEALAVFRGNITRTAKALGIGRNTLYEKIKKYGISLEG
ncbi:sigma-54-dependent Fis family transcriptional regulator [Desulfofundulus thermosubterraneus]|uniref:GAF domain-containing protein n=1 Tax=Desulfofundulus thermosubterraneus DSM 16057 TaxID=1121432 RepID=A0A1M6GK99_9FIRM|nr:sigma-54-dependent Fis family transcriptional regulator [Desulfofundulus thermosubterraneus]SHJ10377.1 GAF domain-containing protein [Desulfofundulus thermosubterraneus DSM 16057]